MQSQYVKPLPQDASSNSMQEFPSPIPAQATTVSENATVSSIINLGHNTTSLEVTTLGVGAVIKWIATGNTGGSVVAVAGSTSNYDHAIPPNWVRRFVVPREVVGNPQSIQGVNRKEGLYQRVAWKTLGIASVFLTEI